MKSPIAKAWLVLLAAACAHATSPGSAGSVAFAAPGAGAPTLKVQRSGSQASRQGPVENFTGSVRVDPVFQATEPARASGAYVTFAPGARSAWHTHPLGQTLVVTAGVGRIQRWSDPIEEMRPGDVIWIPPGQKHWHGAAPESAMTHLAVTEHLQGKTVDWLEKVSDTQYGAAPAAAQASFATSTAGTTSAPAVRASGQPTAAQKIIGDLSPKLVELTDKVLFGDVWERPQLSKRDRSLVTVSALIAMNRPEQLRSHMVRARENGITQEQLIETITHLAFYAGWPSAITAISVAKDVFGSK